MGTAQVLAGRTAMVTGSNRGIGAAVVAGLAEAGANVVAHTRLPSQEMEQHWAMLVEKYGVSIRSVHFDLCDVTAMKSAIAEVFAGPRQLNILVNNAGVAHGGLLQMTRVDDVRRVFEVNYFAQVALTQLLLRRIAKSGSGSIVNMASIAGLDAKAGNTAYGASKAALIAFTKTLAAEMGASGVRVNAVAPGLTDTDMASAMERRAGERMVSDSAMHRLATPREIANVVVFLASDGAAFINGQVIRVDGGAA